MLGGQHTRTCSCTCPAQLTVATSLSATGLLVLMSSHTVTVSAPAHSDKCLWLRLVAEQCHCHHALCCAPSSAPHL